MERLSLLAWIASLAVLGCYDPVLPDGMQACDSTGACPDGYECLGGRCYRPNANNLPDLVSCVPLSCSGARPLCDADGGVCVECLSESDCPAGKICCTDPSGCGALIHTCQAGCSATHDCGDGGSCDPTAGRCHACQSDTECAAQSPDTPRCDPGSHRCEACLPDGPNGPDNCMPTSDGTQTGCVYQGGQYQCVPVQCRSDSDCMAPTSTCCNFTCVDTSSDGKNCGSCNSDCHGLTCCAGACADTSSDTQNCGGCGMACKPPNVNQPQCSAGMCGFDMCQDPTTMSYCGPTPDKGCLVTASDPAHCGGCKTACSTQNLAGAATCTNDVCGGTCKTGYADCNKGISTNDGCETPLGTSQNCSMCGDACASGMICSASKMCVGCLAGSKPPAACTTGQDLIGLNKGKFVVCYADCTKAWISNTGSTGMGTDSGKYYVLKVCQQLGYLSMATPVKNIAGCSYQCTQNCLSSGSCMNNLAPDDTKWANNAVCGTDQYGYYCSGKVQWECLK